MLLDLDLWYSFVPKCGSRRLATTATAYGRSWGPIPLRRICSGNKASIICTKQEELAKLASQVPNPLTIVWEDFVHFSVVVKLSSGFL